MKFRNRQLGASFAGWLVMILLFGGILALGMKLFPVYMDHNTIVEVLEGIAAEPGLAEKRNPDLLSLMTQRLKVNNIRNFNLKENVVINRDSGTRITVAYEVRMPLIHNLDMVASFRDEVILR